METTGLDVPLTFEEIDKIVLSGMNDNIKKDFHYWSQRCIADFDLTLDQLHDSYAYEMYSRYIQFSAGAYLKKKLFAINAAMLPNGSLLRKREFWKLVFLFLNGTYEKNFRQHQQEQQQEAQSSSTPIPPYTFQSPPGKEPVSRYYPRGTQVVHEERPLLQPPQRTSSTPVSLLNAPRRTSSSSSTPLSTNVLPPSLFPTSPERTTLSPFSLSKSPRGTLSFFSPSSSSALPVELPLPDYLPAELISELEPGFVDRLFDIPSDLPTESETTRPAPPLHLFPWKQFFKDGAVILALEALDWLRDIELTWWYTIWKIFDGAEIPMQIFRKMDIRATSDKTMEYLVFFSPTFIYYAYPFLGNMLKNTRVLEMFLFNPRVQTGRFTPVEQPDLFFNLLGLVNGIYRYNPAVQTLWESRKANLENLAKFGQVGLFQGKRRC